MRTGSARVRAAQVADLKFYETLRKLQKYRRSVGAKEVYPAKITAFMERIQSQPALAPYLVTGEAMPEFLNNPQAPFR